MRFRDSKLWSAWPLLLIFEAASLWMTYEMCKDIAQRPLLWKDAYATTIVLNLLIQMSAGMLIWSAFHSLSVYEVGAEGIRCKTFPDRHWVCIPWMELIHGGIYISRSGEMENYIFFSNYQFNGKNANALMNNGNTKYVLFTIPLSKRGIKAIRMYVPDQQLQLLTNSPWLWKSKHAKSIMAILEDRQLLCSQKDEANGVRTNEIQG